MVQGEFGEHWKKDRICHKPLELTSNGFWKGGEPFSASFPLFMLQICIMIATTQLLCFLLKPLKQPRVISELLAGMIIGPSVLGRNKAWRELLFPRPGEKLVRVSGCIGCTMYLFLMGVRMDPSLVSRAGRKTVAIAVIGTFIPFALSAATAFAVSSTIPANIAKGPFLFFIPAVLCISSFPNTAHFLTEIELLNSELGQIALASSLVSDYIGWTMLTVFTGINQAQKGIATTAYALSSLLALVLFLVFVFRPWTQYIISKVPKGGHVKQRYVSIILLGALLSSFASDFIGASISLGPLAMGLVIPGGPPLGSTLMERAEMLVMEVFLPYLYMIGGMSTDVSVIFELREWFSLILIVLVLHLGKLVVVMVTSLCCNMYLRSAFLVGLIMCYRGLVELMHFLNWWNGGLLSEKAFTVMIISTCGITCIVTPLLRTLYDPLRSCVSYSTVGTIEHTKANTELRVLACVHNEEPVPSVINLLESMNATETNPMCVYVLQLVELVGQAFPLLIPHKLAADREELPDPVLRAFLNYESRESPCVVVQPFTTVSPYKTMHQDVCRLAGEKTVAIMIVPFRRKEKNEILVSKADQAVRNMIPVLVARAPCSVGILLYQRGNGSRDMQAFGSRTRHFAVVFWGGPDDREALALASRMASMDGVTIAVLRFVQVESRGDEEEGKLDEEAILQFRTKNITYPADDVDVNKVTFNEAIVSDQVQSMDSIRFLAGMYDLLIVGRQPRKLSEGLMEWSDCPELGVLGDMFASLDTVGSCSVLIVHQGS